MRCGNRTLCHSRRMWASLSGRFCADQTQYGRNTISQAFNNVVCSLFSFNSHFFFRFCIFVRAPMGCGWLIVRKEQFFHIAEAKIILVLCDAAQHRMADCQWTTKIASKNMPTTLHHTMKDDDDVNIEFAKLHDYAHSWIYCEHAYMETRLQNYIFYIYDDDVYM